MLLWVLCINPILKSITQYNVPNSQKMVIDAETIINKNIGWVSKFYSGSSKLAITSQTGSMYSYFFLVGSKVLEVACSAYNKCLLERKTHSGVSSRKDR